MFSIRYLLRSSHYRYWHPLTFKSLGVIVMKSKNIAPPPSTLTTHEWANVLRRHLDALNELLIEAPRRKVGVNIYSTVDEKTKAIVARINMQESL